MSICRPLYLLGVALLCYCSALVQAKERVEWIATQSSPFEVAVQQQRDQGPAEQLRQLLIHALPQYQHGALQRVDATALESLFERGNTCHATLSRTAYTERARYLSVAVGFAHARVVLTTPEIYRRLAQPREVSLTQLLSDTWLRMGVVSHALSPQLRAIVKREAYQPNILYRNTLENDRGLVDMLHRKQIDYFVGYPAQAMYWNKLYPDKPLIAVPLKEVAVRYLTGHVTCSRSDLGREVVEKVNQILLEEREKPEYAARFVFEWMPRAMKKDYLRHYFVSMPSAVWTNVN
ncbi:MAG: hypothetical protein ACPG4U_02760 [Pseudomonadales bacterium]